MPSNFKKRKILWNKNQICFVCRRKIKNFGDASVEHVLPKSKGGGDSFRNLALSHRRCNHLRGNIICRLVFELKLKIRRSKRKLFKNLSPQEIEQAWLEKIAER